MAGKRVAVVVGDIGGAVELVPAVKELHDRGIEVEWIVDPLGQGWVVLDREAIAYGVAGATGYEVGQVFGYDLVLVGTSATAVQAQIEWTRRAQTGAIPVLWYEDLWGTGERPVVHGVTPDVMLVVDQVAGQIAQRARPALATVVVGKPTFEELSAFDEPRIFETRQRLRRQAGVSDDVFLLVYWGAGDPARVTIHLSVLRELPRVGSRPVTLAPRLHPKMPGHREAWQLVFEGPAAMINLPAVPALELNCAADAVFGEFGGTQTYAAALVGTLPIIAMWPDNREKRLACGFPDGDPPLIDQAIGAGAESPRGLVAVLEAVAAGDVCRSDIFRRGREIFCEAIRPGAAGRIAETVVRFLLR